MTDLPCDLINALLKSERPGRRGVLKGGEQGYCVGRRRKGWGNHQGFSEQNPGNRKPEERAQGGACDTLWL